MAIEIALCFSFCIHTHQLKRKSLLFDEGLIYTWASIARYTGTIGLRESSLVELNPSMSMPNTISTLT